MALKQTLKVLIAGTLLGALVLVSYEVFFWWTHVYENDARIQTDLTKISPQINGKIKHILVKERAMVTEGQPLILMVDDDIRTLIKALRTDLGLKKAETEKLLAEKQVFELELQSKLSTQVEKIKLTKLEYASINGRLSLANKSLDRVTFSKKINF